MPLDPQFVHTRLKQAARRFRWSRFARFAISGSAVSLAFLVLFLWSDTEFHFQAGGRWTAFALVLLPLLAGAALAVREALPVHSEASMARRIETACGDARNVLISAVQFDREPSLPAGLRAALFHEMRDPFPQVDWSVVFDLKLLKRLAAGLAGAAAILAVCAAIRPLYFANSAKRILLPGSDTAPLTRTRIAALAPGDARVVHGADLTVTARLAGEIPRTAWISFREPGDGGDWRKVLMDREVGSDTFSYTWNGVRQPFDYRLEAGDAASRTFHVEVRPKTVVRNRDASIELPPYARRAAGGKAAPVVLKNFTVLQNVLPGSAVAVTLDFNNPLAQLAATAEKGAAFKVEKLTGTRWRISAAVPESETVRLDYRDADAGDGAKGVAGSDSFRIATKADEPPKIEVSEPAEGKEVFAPPGAALAIRFSASDNLGLASVALYRSTEEAPDAELIREWKEAAGQRLFAGECRVPLAKYAKEDRVTFCLVAKDQNDVSGPGVTYSRPLVVTLRTPDQILKQSAKAAEAVRGGLDALIGLQKTNLEATGAAARTPEPAPAALKALLDRQARIAETGRALAASAEALSPAARSDLAALSQKEMPAAVVALRTAASAPAGARRAESLEAAIKLESAILVRLQGSSEALAGAKARGQIEDLIAGVETLLRKQRDLFGESAKAAAQSAAPLSARQDALAGEATRVRKQLQAGSLDAAMGDPGFHARLGEAATLFGKARVYEGMLTAAEKLQSGAFPEAGAVQKGVIASLAKIADLLNQWQFANAAKEADALKKAAKEMGEKLAKLAAIQREIVEKSREMPRKSDVRPEDVATAKAVKESKDLMAEVVEQMLTDAHIFPDLKPSNELRGELTQIFEDVIQTDQAQAAAGQLKANEVAVQKEDGILKAIEQAQKIAEDMEMWLPNKNDTTKWLLENFDKTEMPDIPNLPLPDAFSDLVGNLLKEQEGLAQQAQDASSNQLMAQNPANGWEVSDGPQGGFGAQGKSGNTRPNKNEQTGRSSGGREGESDGEMVGDTAGNLEGTKPDARRTNDPMQQGHVKDEGGIGETRATGGGKSGGFSDRNGMDGNAPLRPVNAPRMAASDALAVQQALLAEKTSKMVGEASLLYLKTGGLPGVVRLMDESQRALKEGRTRDFRSLHRKIVTRLNEVRGNVTAGEVVSLPTGDAARVRDKELLGGDEGQAPAAYREAVADYYRSLLDAP